LAFAPLQKLGTEKMSVDAEYVFPSTVPNEIGAAEKQSSFWVANGSVGAEVAPEGK